MKIDLHVHSNSSDGKLSAIEIIEEAKKRQIFLLSITDHDSIDCQQKARNLARSAGLQYITGVELNVTFSDQKIRNGKPISLDFLGYRFDESNSQLETKLRLIAGYRKERAAKILENLNVEFEKEGLGRLTSKDFEEIEASVDGVLGRPHIADYLVKKRIVASRQEAFDKYMVKCDVPKYPLTLEEASKIIRNAGGKLVFAHPNDPHGTSLNVLTSSLTEQTTIIEERMLSFIDGIECWHSRSDSQTTQHYLAFSKTHGLITSGGSDCHQKPIIMGTVPVPDYVASQFLTK